MHTASLALVLLLVALPASAQSVRRSVQYSAKFLGLTVIRECPTPEVIEQIRMHGEALGASYTEFPEVSGASLCPATIYGPLWGLSSITATAPGSGADCNHDGYPDYQLGSEAEGTWKVIGGVTVGLHFQVTR